jgi:hypothetical protein
MVALLQNPSRIAFVSPEPARNCPNCGGGDLLDREVGVRRNSDAAVAASSSTASRIAFQTPAIRAVDCDKWSIDGNWLAMSIILVGISAHADTLTWKVS